jgi:riboflavin synthase
VQGHVDGVGTVLARGADNVVRIGLPPGLSRYLVPKGSVTVDGISLTVVEVGDDWFTVALIPTTLARTTLGLTPIGGPVNIEADVVAKHIERLIGIGTATEGNVEA